MKLRNLLIAGMFSFIAFTSCKNDASEGENEDLELRESDREAELRANEQRLESERNSVTARIQENQDLSTFSENMNRNQVTQSMYQDRSTMTGQGQTTTGQGQTTQDETSTTRQAQNATNNQSSGQGQTATGQTANKRQNTAGQTGNQMQGQGSYTIFAPSNSAYEGLSETERNQMNSNTPENRDRNVASINYLMVEERLTEDNLRQQIQNSNGSYQIRTMQGENITATLENNQIVLRDAAGNQARITQTDSTASDGVVHVIDGVLRPKDPTRNAAASRMNNRTNNQGTGTGTGTGTTDRTSTGTGTGR